MKIKSISRKRPVPDGYMCFSLDGATHAQRSVYSNDRREQVHEVRKVGACLRCQLLKRSCSKGDPCLTCVRAAAKNSASRSLAWMECIRPSLLNVSIFGSANYYDRELQLGGVPVLQYLAHGDVDLKFDIPFQWNIDELSTFVAGWLVNDHDAPRASMVGIMSSASLLSVVSDLVGPDLAQAFKALIYTSSLIFNSTNGRMVYSEKSNDIRILKHCGCRLLMHLESHIRPAELARLQKHELYAIFLLLLGCIIASKYVSESLGDLTRLASASITATSQQQLQPMNTLHSDVERGSQLVRLLSHQLVYIGQCTGLLREGMDKNLIQDLTSSTWRKKAVFTWEAVDQPMPNASSADLYTNTQLLDIDCAPGTSQPDMGHLVWNSPFTVGDKVLGQHVLNSCSTGSVRSSYTRNYSEERAQKVRHIRRMGSCMMCRRRSSHNVRNDGQNEYICVRCQTPQFGSQKSNIRSINFTQFTETARRAPVGSSSAGTEHSEQSTQPTESFIRKNWVCVVCTTEYESSNELMAWTPTDKNCLREMLSGALVCHRCGDDIANMSAANQFLDKTAEFTTPFSVGSHTGMNASLGTYFDPPSPMDFDMAAFDPDLPTLGIDLSPLQPEHNDLWPCLNRIPSPPPEHDLELEQAMKAFEQRSEEWKSASSLRQRAEYHSARRYCGQSVSSNTLQNDIPLDFAQRRLLL